MDGAPLCHVLSLEALGVWTRLEKIGLLAVCLPGPRSEQLAQRAQGTSLLKVVAGSFQCTSFALWMG